MLLGSLWTRVSVDILFIDCLKRMNLNVMLEPVETALYRFTGGAIKPLGQVMLQVGLGAALQRRVIMVKFVIVDVPSSYNVMFGRPMLTAF